MSRPIDADALEREGWSLHRTFQKDAHTMVYETKKPSDFPTIEPEQTAEEYRRICFDLCMSMLEGTKFDSVKITEDGIVLMQKGGKE